LYDVAEFRVAEVAGVLGLVALVVAVRAPSWDRLQRWVSQGSRVVADAEVSLARALLTRTGLVTLATFAVLAPLTLAVQLKAAGPALALATAVVVGAGASIDGGRTRRASLSTVTPEATPRPVVLLIAWPVILACLSLLLWWNAEGQSGPFGFTGWGGGTAMPDLDRWLLPVLAVAALVHAGALVAVLRRVHRRRAVPGVPGDLDAALRALQQRRAVTGALTGNLVLSAVLANAAPLLTLPVGPEPLLLRGVGMATSVAVGLTLAFLAVCLIRWGAGVDPGSETPFPTATPSPHTSPPSPVEYPAGDSATSVRPSDETGRG